MSSSIAPIKLAGGRGRNALKSSSKSNTRSVAPTSQPRNGRVWPNIVDLDAKTLAIERHLKLDPAKPSVYTKIISEGQLVGFQIRNATMLVPLREDNYGGHNFSLGLSQDYNQLQALLDMDTVWTSIENYPLLRPEFAADHELVGKTKVWGSNSDCLDLKITKFPPKVFDIKGEVLALEDIKKFDHVDVVIELKAFFSPRAEEGSKELVCGWVYNVKQVRRIAHAEEKTDEDAMIL